MELLSYLKPPGKETIVSFSNQEYVAIRRILVGLLNDYEKLLETNYYEIDVNPPDKKAIQELLNLFTNQQIENHEVIFVNDQYLHIMTLLRASTEFVDGFEGINLPEAEKISEDFFAMTKNSNQGRHHG